MDIENARAIVDKLEWDHNDDRAAVDENYSGRGMYGKTTAAVVCSNPDDVVFIMGKLGIEDSRRVDNLGLGYVVY